MIGGDIALFVDPATGHGGQERLAQFGTYFGGVEAPLLALLTVVGLALTLMLQNHQLKLAQDDRLLVRHVRMLDETWRDLEKLETTPFRRVMGRLCTLKAIFNGTVDAEDVDRKSLSLACEAYLKHLGTYAKGVNLFRDTFDTQWDYEVLLARGQDGRARISPFLSYLDPMHRMSFGWIDHHLNAN